MIKKLALVACVMLAGCGMIKDALNIERDINCFERAAISKVAVDTAFKSAADASEGEIISVGAAKEALKILNSSNSLVDHASSLCSLDEATAYDYLDTVTASLADVNLILKGE